MTPTDPLPWLRLARLPGIGPVLAKRLLAALGSPTAILTAHPANLAAVDGIGTHRASQIVAAAESTQAPAHIELEQARHAGLTLLTPDHPLYPPGLQTITDPPLILYLRGHIQPTDAVAIGIVGARQCTFYGREQATRLASELAAAGLTIISGGARGIDTAAHIGALRAKGRTLVIQGCGLNHTYPPENTDLYAQIINDGGAILSELPLDAPPAAENFPPRNRIIAGMSLGILVIEANLRSGSLITARLAAADYGREVFALPGRVDSSASAGTHHLIKSAAAHLVESAADILGHLGDVGSILRKAGQAAHAAQPAAPDSLFTSVPKPAPLLTTLHKKILAAIPPTGASIDDLIEATTLPPQVIMAELTLLQLHGHLTRLPDNRIAPTTPHRQT